MSTTVRSTRAVDKSVPLSHFSTPFIPPLLSNMQSSAPILENPEPQLQSPLFNRLPAELRNQIYFLCLTSTSPIVDPCIPPTYSAHAKLLNLETKSHRIPYLGTPLLRSCKRIYAEVSLSPLFSANTFRFTTSFSAQRFLAALPQEYAEKIQDVEVDLREVGDAHPAVEREWVQWLSSKPELNFWGAKVGLSRVVAPNIKTLRFNIEGWKHTESIRSVAILKEILQGPRNLERIVMMGLDGSELLFGAKERFLELWGPAIWVGVMRFARLAGMVNWLAACIEGERGGKIVMWEKQEHRISLEIMSVDAFKRQMRFRNVESLESSNYNAESGCLTLVDYERRWQSGEWPNSIKS